MFFKKKPQKPTDDYVIIGCPKTRITKETFERVIEEYDKLPGGLWLFNLGNGNYQGQRNYENQGYSIINKVEAIKNCSNKKKMFRILHNKKVPTLGYYDLTLKPDRIRARDYIRYGGVICLRKKKALVRIKTTQEFDRLHNLYDYATAQEIKRYEYRVVMINNDIVIVYCKNPHKHVFKYKQEYCNFARLTLPKNDPIIRVCKQATRALDIDMCGVDILVNTKGEPKIIEVNSGNGMAGRTVKKIMKML